ncbi:MAG: LytTR family transcriptional regulator DNA-binding domain-containing protein, partial [Rikenellaceae bacterium]
DAADYLVKPISYATFLKSVEKVSKRFFTSPDIEHIFVRSECRSVRVTLSEILYIESRREYMDIHLSSGEVVSTISNVSTMHDKLPKARFIKAHRSFIVNLDNVSVVENHSIIFDKQRIPVSKEAREVIAKLTRQIV